MSYLFYLGLPVICISLMYVACKIDGFFKRSDFVIFFLLGLVPLINLVVTLLMCLMSLLDNIKKPNAVVEWFDKPL